MKTLPITINVSKKIEFTNAPYWLIIDPNCLRKELSDLYESYETTSLDAIPNKDIISLITHSARGPFFSREEALEALPLTKHRSYFGDEAVVYCVSGSSNPQYTTAYQAALKAAGLPF